MDYQYVPQVLIRYLSTHLKKLSSCDDRECSIKMFSSNFCKALNETLPVIRNDNKRFIIYALCFITTCLVCLITFQMVL